MGGMTLWYKRFEENVSRAEPGIGCTACETLSLEKRWKDSDFPVFTTKD